MLSGQVLGLALNQTSEFLVFNSFAAFVEVLPLRNNFLKSGNSGSWQLRDLVDLGDLFVSLLSFYYYYYSFLFVCLFVCIPFTFFTTLIYFF